MNAHDEIEPKKLRTVVVAASAGTVFEWYDFFIFGSLATIVAKHFFAGLPDSQAFVFTLLTFAIGFLARPFGALVFGKIGDSRGRKGAFLVTITMMGLATFAIGLLPDFDQIGILAPVLLVVCRILQGFALGGEYGGAAIYVAEHAPDDARGFNTSWIQTSAALGLLAALGVILTTRSILGEDRFGEWGWRVPFLLSLGLLAISLYIRMRLEESPAFQKIKAAGETSKNVMSESFLDWKNLKIVLIALFGIMLAQGVVWYTGHFYAQFFLERLMKVDGSTVNLILIVVTFVSAFLYVFFGWLSDKIGRKPVMLFGMVLMLAAYFPGFHLMARAANPAMAEASRAHPIVVRADPAACSFMLDLTGGASQFSTACDIARDRAANAGASYTLEPAPGAATQIKIGARVLDVPDASGKSASEVKAVKAEFGKRLAAEMAALGYPAKADPKSVNMPVVILVLLVFVTAATALYGPQAAALVELFPTRIRYTAMSLPYHVGTGWFGGLLPFIAFSIVTATGDIYAGLWYPFVGTLVALGSAILFLPETRRRDIHAADLGIGGANSGPSK